MKFFKNQGFWPLLLAFLIGSFLSFGALKISAASNPVPGSSEDPVVTKSYVDNFVSQKKNELAAKASSLEEKVNTLQKEVDALTGVSPSKLLFTIDSPQVAYVSQFKKAQVAPQIIGSTTMIPFRFLGEALGAEVSWDNTLKQATFEKEGTVIKLTIGKKEALVNGKTVTMDLAPVNLQGNTMVPLRFVSEYLGAAVEYDSATRTILITP